MLKFNIPSISKFVIVIVANTDKGINLYLPQIPAPGYDYHWATTIGYTEIIFRVKACRDVKILFSEVVGRDDIATPLVSVSV